MSRHVQAMAMIASFAAIGSVACKSSPEFKGGADYASGANRNAGDSSKEDLLNNSAFEDAGADGADGADGSSGGRNGSGSHGGSGRDKADLSGIGGNDDDAGNPSAADSTIDIVRLCSNKFTSRAGTNLKAAEGGILISLVPAPGNDKGKSVFFNSATIGKKARSDILNLGKFTLPLQRVRGGAYYLTICNANHNVGCKMTADQIARPIEVNGLSGKQSIPSSGPRFGDTPGVLGGGLVTVKEGKLIDINGAFIPQGKAQVIEVLTDKNVEGSIEKQQMFNTFATLMGGAVAPTNISAEDLDSISNCDKAISPLIVDFGNKGIGLSAPFPGTPFDIDGNGLVDNISWPTARETMFVVLDVNGNGKIDDGRELFGNSTIGLDGKAADNGFLALAKFDDNKDGQIDARDSVYTKLRLWSDNGDGISTADELLTLESQGVASIDLAYVAAKEIDAFANMTLQRSSVKLKSGALRMIVDLWFRVM